MVGITGKDAKDLEFKPTHAQGDGNDADGENDSGDEGVNGILTQRNG